MPNYHEAFNNGEAVRVVELDALLKFQHEWPYHHPLQEVQLAYAGKPCFVHTVSFYHGGACLYELETSIKNDPPSRYWHQETVPGFWHEQCLTDSTLIYWDQKSMANGNYSSPLAADVYVVNSEIRDGQNFVVVKSKEGSEFLAFRHSHGDVEAQSMREVACIRNAISFENRYNFQGVGHEILQKRLAETKMQTT